MKSLKRLLNISKQRYMKSKTPLNTPKYAIRESQQRHGYEIAACILDLPKLSRPQLYKANGMSGSIFYNQVGSVLSPTLSHVTIGTLVLIACSFSSSSSGSQDRSGHSKLARMSRGRCVYGPRESSTARKCLKASRES